MNTNYSTMRYDEFVAALSVCLSAVTLTVALAGFLHNRIICYTVSDTANKVDNFEKRFNAWDDRYDEWEDYFDDWDDRIEDEQVEEEEAEEKEFDYHTYTTEAGEYVHYMKYAENDFMLVIPRHEAIRGKSIINVFLRRETRSTHGHVQMTYVTKDGSVQTLSIIRNDPGLHMFLSELIDE